ncbi:hypothetical protein T07_8850 [Trichinella nelsoni]|uniref:Uncharacterized protein n=1 Tax=Trichinella nelsoni TaxID=6336 RepID=A0A0V0RZY2_9BILA|nr:hypothetical protein T07_8850 [Trichinella nelsoni]
MVHSQVEESKRKMLSTAFHICDLIACLELFTDEFLPEQWSFRKGAVNTLEARAARPVEDPPFTRARTACTWLNGRLKIHAFCDASERAYDAVAYLPTEATNHYPVVNFVTAKKAPPMRDERRSARRVTVAVTTEARSISLVLRSTAAWKSFSHCQRFIRNCRMPLKPVRTVESQQLNSERQKARGCEWPRWEPSVQNSRRCRGRGVTSRPVGSVGWTLSWMRWDAGGPRFDNGIDQTLPRAAATRWDHQYAAALRQQYWVLKGRAQVMKVNGTVLLRGVQQPD